MERGLEFMIIGIDRADAAHPRVNESDPIVCIDHDRK
jgi:hypothetical protein